MVREGAGKARILIVDDVLAVRTMLQHVLARAGYSVTCTASGVEAARHIDAEVFDLVLSDISMPGLDGIGLLRKVRERDADLPVILLTGVPNAATAISAVNLAATAYLAKPVTAEALVIAVQRALALRRLLVLRPEESACAAPEPSPSASAVDDLTASFGRALEGLFMVYQPIASASRRTAFAYEALVRSSEPTMAYPGALLDAAEELDRLGELGRAIRRSCAETFVEADPRARLFVNLHPYDLLDESLVDPREPLARMASRVVLEITDRARLDDVSDLETRVARLRRAGFRIAIDDIAAGYSGLSSFASIRPEFVKLDMALIRGIDADPTKQRIARMLAELSGALDIGVVAEGVETAAERDSLISVGCDLFQGYFFARPGAPFPVPRFDP